MASHPIAQARAETVTPGHARVTGEMRAARAARQATPKLSAAAPPSAPTRVHGQPHGLRMSEPPSIDRFHGNGDAIAGAAFGNDDLRLGGIAFELAPQPQDLHVDRAVIDLVVVTAAHLD